MDLESSRLTNAVDLKFYGSTDSVIQIWYLALATHWPMNWSIGLGPESQRKSRKYGRSDLLIEITTSGS